MHQIAEVLGVSFPGQGLPPAVLQRDSQGFVCISVCHPTQITHVSLLSDSGDCNHPNKCWKGPMAGHQEFWIFLKSEEDNIYNPDS